MKIKNAILSAAALMVLAAAPAMAAGTVLGRITYISTDGHHLILDGQKEYTVGPGVDVSRIGVAEFVQATMGANDTITAVSPGPAAQAGYWTPRSGQS